VDSTRLKIFISAAQSLNFSEVARAFYISQPSVTYQITLLERELGVPLFNRSGKSLSLTEDGLLFLPNAVSILSKIENAKMEIDRRKEGRSGKVSVVASNTCTIALKKCLNTFYAECPDTLVEIQTAIGFEHTAMLKADDFDVFFTSEKFITSKLESLDFIHTHTDCLGLAMPESYPEIKSLYELPKHSDFPFIGLAASCSPSLQSEIFSLLASIGYAPKITTRYNRIESVLLSIEAGVGVSIIPRSLLYIYRCSNVRFVPTENRLFFAPCIAAWHRDCSNLSALRFIDVMKKVFKDKN